MLFTAVIVFREVHKGPEAFVKFYYLPGNYTLKLSIETDAPQHSRMTGLYSVDLTVLGECRLCITYNKCLYLTLFIVPVMLTNHRLFCFIDAIRYIELIGPVIYNVDQRSRLSFEVGGR